MARGRRGASSSVFLRRSREDFFGYTVNVCTVSRKYWVSFGLRQV
jgi:hypothetical protein